MFLYCIYWLVLLMDTHCDSLKYNQQDATLYNILYYCQCCTCFRRFSRPSSGAQKLYTQHLVCVKLVRPRIQPDHAATEQLKIYLWWNCWDSSRQDGWASIVTVLWARQYRVWIWQGREISYLEYTQTSPRAHTASCSMSTGAVWLFPVGKGTRAWSWSLTSI